MSFNDQFHKKKLAIKLFIRMKIAESDGNLCPDYKMYDVTGLGKFQLYCCNGNSYSEFNKLDIETQKCRVRSKFFF